MAEQQLEDSVVLATMMLALDEVDGLVSGAIHTTASTIRPALQLIKTAPGYNLVSSVFFMLLPDQVLVYGDCAVNPDPSASDLAEIAVQSAASAQAFGIPARVAMISYSTGDSGSGVDVDKVREATRLAREQRPDLLIDGPLQYDAAAIASVGRQKAPNSPVAGQATVFIFPDLNTGNTPTGGAAQRRLRQRRADAARPAQTGERPARGALVEDIVTPSPSPPSRRTPRPRLNAAQWAALASARHEDVPCERRDHARSTPALAGRLRTRTLMLSFLPHFLRGSLAGSLLVSSTLCLPAVSA